MRWLLKSPARFIAFGFGSGLLRPGPGTWGTLLAWPIWLLTLAHFSDMVVGICLAIFFLIGCWLCQIAGRDVGKADHGGIVWDEMVAFWLVLWLTPTGFWPELTAFVLFRFFDIMKPPPIRYFDRRWHNGFGVMWDDILAAGYSLLVMALLVRLGVFA
jgi:phosphatidylglycerophosphatase A